MEQSQLDIFCIIKEYCTQIRNAILFIKEQSSLFKNFPTGCCRDTSIVAGLYLKEKGFSDILYCNKEFSQTLPSHAWIEYKGLIIDLTANQFSNEFPDILIIPVTEESQYHKKMKEEICDLSIAGMDSVTLFNDYSLIKDHIAKNDFLFVV